METSFSFFEGKFIKTIAKRIKTIPTHCIKSTFSPSKTKAMVTETGSSSDETMLPSPNPAFGNPTLNKMGGIIVPKRASTNPYVENIE
jgi:hypothetical protein